MLGAGRTRNGRAAPAAVLASPATICSMSARCFGERACVARGFVVCWATLQQAEEEACIDIALRKRHFIVRKEIACLYRVPSPASPISRKRLTSIILESFGSQANWS